MDVQIPENCDKQKGTIDWSLFLTDWNGDKVSGDVNISLVNLKNPGNILSKENGLFLIYPH